MTARDTETVQTLANGLAVIAAFGPNSPSMTITEASARAGLTRAAARRILRTLEALDYARVENNRYELTPRVLNLGFSFLKSTEIGDRADPILRRASDTLRETCSLGLPSGTDMVYVAHAICEDRLFSTRFTIGARLPMAATAIGRAYLAHLSEPDRDRALETITPRSETPHTVIDRGALRSILSKTRAQGYAVTQEEYEIGALSVAVPVPGADGNAVAGLNIVVNKGRVSTRDMIDRFVPTLKDAATDLGLALG